VIPRANIVAWRASAPWPTDAQVEQDLVISRAIVEIYSDPVLASALAFRGGTAIYKLFLTPPARYSEDIDLVQVKAGAAGELMTALRAKLDPWLGTARYRQRQGRVTFLYRFESEIPPVTPMRLKVEINTREHFTVLGLQQVPLRVENPWFTGESPIVTYFLEELLATKLRALYQRKKGRDLFDLAAAIERFPTLDDQKVVACFQSYLKHSNTSISRAEFEAGLSQKKQDKAFLEDITPLIAATSSQGFDAARALDRVQKAFVQQLPGEPWKGGEDK
jgi:predicted nucleotidyltransferase component of viral defense system